MSVSSCCGFVTVQTGVSIIGLFYIISAIPLCARVILNPLGIWYMHLAPIVCLLSGIMLIIGAKRRRSEFLFLPLCLYFTSIVLLIPADFIHQFQLATFMADATPIFMVIFIGIFHGLSIYFFMVIYTFYEVLLREKYAVPINDTRVDAHSSDP